MVFTYCFLFGIIVTLLSLISTDLCYFVVDTLKAAESYFGSYACDTDRMCTCDAVTSKVTHTGPASMRHLDAFSDDSGIFGFSPHHAYGKKPHST